MVAMMINHVESSKLDLKVKNKSGKTAFQLAKIHRRHEIVDLIKKKLPLGTFWTFEIVENKSFEP